MKKIYQFSLKLFLALALITSVALPRLAFADDPDPGSGTTGFGFDKVDGIATDAGYNPGSEPTLEARISSFISIFLSFLGVIFLILMIYAGFNWMTAAGDEKKIEKAKETIRASLIGIIIVIAAYAISVFVVSRIWGATTSTPPISLGIQTVYAEEITPTVNPPAIVDRLKTVGSNAGYGAADERSMLSIIGTVINGFLGLLGAIFIILILVAGYNWMTAAGDEKKIEKAKDTIRAAVIGLIIIIGAYAIWNFIATYLIGAPGGQIEP